MTDAPVFSVAAQQAPMVQCPEVGAQAARTTPKPLSSVICHLSSVI
jgi:hypothetical protein